MRLGVKGSPDVAGIGAHAIIGTTATATGASIALVKGKAVEACAGVSRLGTVDVVEDGGSTSPVGTWQ